MLKGLRTSLAVCLLAPAIALATADINLLSPEAVQQQTLKEIVGSLNIGHYNKISVDDTLSSGVLDEYLAELDPSRSYFYQSDISEFEAYRYTLDDSVLAGDLDSAFVISNRQQQRVIERLTWTIDRLSSDEAFNFDVDETLDTDRENDPWISSQDEMNDLWRKRNKSALLSLMLSDKTEQEAREVLIKRYTNQLKRLSQNKSEDVFQRFANVLTKHFDPHTSYFSPRSSENFKINMSLSLEGIGAVLQSENEFTKIVRLVPAGPADKTGLLKPADLIVGVGQSADGEIEDVVGWRLDDVVDLIRGPKDSTVRLEIIPSDSEDQAVRKIIPITRNTVALEEQAAQKRILTIKHNNKDYKVGVIDIPAFYIDFEALQRGDENYKSTTRDVENLITELQSEKIDGLIIDLRNNGGGSLREANELVGLFIDRGPTVQIRDPNGRVDILGDFNPKVAYNGPISVLVNRLSASASEIFAGAIQDYQRGIIVGSQTFGKGTVQTLQALDHGQIKLTHAKFYRISGESTQHKGVIPDIAFPGIYDTAEIGESALDGALPWDQVKEARHGIYKGISTFKAELEKRHAMRTDNQPDFNFLREQITRQAEAKIDETIPLNKVKLLAKRDEAEKWQVNSENKRRLAKGQTPIVKLTELEDLLQKDEKGRPISAESEALLVESGQVLLDMVDLTNQLITYNPQ
ncbi:carboxy terminal-processing peptidase [Neptunomonas antarctica]|uniref:Carboxyl-terminal processing protease n=1 Tax=Neptunomonas antarctica TaxID=619304 RepID=A0A1N7NNS2_9GAMM|nr:carboxy terminal-processing peptidase [Neptunomonas antarctica]SIS99931.1 carboxyl-terminal processing protease [Neptunomonas antarctica]